MVSLSKLCQVNEEGVKFNHPETNAEMFLRPEDSVIAQMGIGADIIMMLDHVVSSVSSKEMQMEAMERTIRWLQRNFNAHGSHSQQNLFPIIQGGLDIEMRR
jgi:queuine tRNA-ribosyltransferase